MRKLAALVAVGAALWLAPGALAWCGPGESAVDLPEAVTGQQIHAIVVEPADGPDNFAAVAGTLENDVSSLVTWWTGQDPTRAPRFDQAVFAAGTCLDISFVRLPDTTASLQGASSAFQRVAGDLEAVGFNNAYKKYFVYYDGPAVEADICGTGGGGRDDFSSGPSFAVVWLQGCPGTANDQVGAHELLHALGALPAGAPHPCPGDSGHPCDDPFVDVLSPFTDGRPLQVQVLDYNRDDYYGHSGSWNDLQDSLWLRHLDVPQVPLAIGLQGGAGRVSSFVPGASCTAACTTQWDQGSVVTIQAVPAAGKRFVGWSGGCTGTGTCALTLTQASSVTAVFGPQTIPVKVTVAGRGKVTCAPACRGLLAAGASLTLRAVPVKGWKFTGWSGGCKGTRPVCRPVTGAAVAVRATFKRKR